MVITKLQNLLQEAFKNTGYECICSVIESNRPELCDYQCDNAFKLAKEYKTSPSIIANAVCNYLNAMPNLDVFFDKVEFANPGFINLTLSNSFINSCLQEMNNTPNFGLKTQSQTVFIDYGGPNVAKPLHVGHLRSAIVGESVKRINQYAGNKTITDVHLGDYGLQIGEVIYGLKEQGTTPENITLEMLEYLYPKMSARCKEDETLKETCAQITKDLQDGNQEYAKYWEVICKLSVNDMKRIYNYLDVSFDLWNGESECYKYLPMLFDKYLQENKLEKSEGAYIINVAKETDTKEIPPLIFKKSNGAYLYTSTEIATIYERLTNYNLNKIIYFTDLRQCLHFEQVFRSCEVLGLGNKDMFEHCPFGTVNGTDGKPFKTREGGSPKLDGLFDQVKDVLIKNKEGLQNAKEQDLDILVNAIIKFADLQNNRERDYIFDIEKFSKISGKTGPYVLYTYLRLNKILQNENLKDAKLNTLTKSESDRNLRIALLSIYKHFKKALNEKMPSYICDYIYNICNIANSFYESNRIKSEQNPQVKNDWLYLINLTTKILKDMLSLLAINIPSVM